MNEPVQYQPAPAPAVSGAHLAPVRLPDGQWVYAPAPPPQVVMQMPAQAGLSREMRELIVVVTLVLAVVMVCTAAVCAVVVIAGGTLIGIVGTVGAHLPFIGVTLVGVILAAGWAAQRVRAAVKTHDGDHGGKRR